MARNKIDFTDKELYCVALAIKSNLQSRETYWTKQSAANFNRMIKKIIDEGLKRKDPKYILHPIVDFDEEEQYYLQLADKSKIMKTKLKYLLIVIAATLILYGICELIKSMG